MKTTHCILLGALTTLVQGSLAAAEQPAAPVAKDRAPVTGKPADPGTRKSAPATKAAMPVKKPKGQTASKTRIDLQLCDQ